MTIRFGVILPGGTADQQLEQAVLAEQAGWDGVFVWEAAYGVDPWSLLGAMAAVTTRVRLGTMLTPLPWRRPWKVASQVATVDQLSGGRVVLGIGVGAVTTDLPLTGEVTDLRTRAAMMDEGLGDRRAVGRGRLHLVDGDPLGDAAPRSRADATDPRPYRGRAAPAAGMIRCRGAVGPAGRHRASTPAVPAHPPAPGFRAPHRHRGRTHPAARPSRRRRNAGFAAAAPASVSGCR